MGFYLLAQRYYFVSGPRASGPSTPGSPPASDTADIFLGDNRTPTPSPSSPAFETPKLPSKTGVLESLKWGNSDIDVSSQTTPTQSTVNLPESSSSASPSPVSPSRSVSNADILNALLDDPKKR